MGAPFTYPVAFSIPFLSEPERINGFQSKNVQEAIEESIIIAPGKARAHRMFQHNGTLGNNFWHGYNELINSFTTPMVIPWNCVLKEYVMCFNNTSVDGEMNFYLNGTDLANIVYSISFVNVDVYKIVYPNLDLSNGDLLRLRWVDNGKNPSDVVSTFDFLLK